MKKLLLASLMGFCFSVSAGEEIPMWETNPDLYDFPVVAFWHDREPDSFGNVIRHVGLMNQPTKELCEVAKQKLLETPVPDVYVLDSIVCVPMLKAVFPLDVNKI